MQRAENDKIGVVSVIYATNDTSLAEHAQIDNCQYKQLLRGL